MLLNIKVGDIVKIKSLEWYNDSCKNCKIEIDGVLFNPDMCKYCGKTSIITAESNGHYILSIDSSRWFWYDWMFEDDYSNEADSDCVELKDTIEVIKEKRFQAACSAMNGILSTEYSKTIPNDKIIQMSYMLADELLKQGEFTE